MEHVERHRLVLDLLREMPHEQLDGCRVGCGEEFATVRGRPPRCRERNRFGPGREREVVRLHYIEGRTYEEISMELNIPVNTIGPILSRARKKLRGDGAAAADKKPAAPKPQKKE